MTVESETEDVGHEFVPYAANPGICSICGAVRPYPCYRLRTEAPGATGEPVATVTCDGCDRPATFYVHAAFQTDPQADQPVFARYDGQHVRCCAACLPEALGFADAVAQVAEPAQWIVSTTVLA